MGSCTNTGDTGRPGDSRPQLSGSVKAGLVVVVVAVVALAGFNTLTRLRHFSPDSYFYLQMAENAASGRGLSHTTHDIATVEHLDSVDEPLPTTIWTPLYPILIAALHKFGLDLTDAALLVSWAGFAATILVMFFLVRRTHGEPLAFLSAAYLTLNGSLAYVTGYAWSETTGIAFTALTFYLVALLRDGTTRPRTVAVLAGAAAGLAFATKYALLPIMGLAALALLEKSDLKRTARTLFFYGLGFLVIAAPVFARNWLVDGSPLGPGRPPSDRGLVHNLFDLGGAFTLAVVPPHFISPAIQATVCWALILVLLVSLAFGRARRRMGAALRTCLMPAFWQGNCRLLTLWGAGYLLFLAVYRTFVWVDPLGPRLASPGVVAIVVPALAFATCALRLRTRGAIAAAWVMLVLSAAAGARLALAPPVDDLERYLRQSERNRWLAEHTRAGDLIIGDHLEAFPRFVPGRTIVNFLEWPGMDPPLDYDRLMRVVARHGASYERVLFAPLKSRLEPEALAAIRGPLLADIEAGRWEQHPALRLQAELSDGYVFTVAVPGKDASEDVATLPPPALPGGADVDESSSAPLEGAAEQGAQERQGLHVQAEEARQGMGPLQTAPEPADGVRIPEAP